MTDPRTETLAALVLELDAMREESKEAAKERREAIASQLERIQALARAIRSGQLQIDDGPPSKIVGQVSREQAQALARGIS